MNTTSELDGMVEMVDDTALYTEDQENKRPQEYDPEWS